MDKPEIKYPCPWSYKVIGKDPDLIVDCIRNQLNDLNYDLNTSNQSRTGRFTSIELSTNVDSEEQRLRIFEILKSIPTVHMVL